MKPQVTLRESRLPGHGSRPKIWKKKKDINGFGENILSPSVSISIQEGGGIDLRYDEDETQ